MTMDEAHSIRQKYSDRVDRNIKKLLTNYMDKNNSLFYTKDLGNPNDRQRVHQSLKRVQRNKWLQKGNHSSLEITNDTSVMNNSIMYSNQPTNLLIGQSESTIEEQKIPVKKQTKSTQKPQFLSSSFSMNQLSNHQQFLPKLKTIKPLNLDSIHRNHAFSQAQMIPLKSERIIPTKNIDVMQMSNLQAAPLDQRRNWQVSPKSILRNQ